MENNNNSTFPDVVLDFFRDKKSPHSHESILTQMESPDYHWIYFQSKLPWLRLDLQAPYSEMLAEAKNVRHRFVSHRAEGGNRGWKSVCIHGASPEHTQDFNQYGYKSHTETPYQWTEIADLCPITSNFFKNHYPCKKFRRVRFMLLEPGGYILPHADRPESHLWEVNIALNHPQGCHFKMADAGYVPFAKHSAFLLDLSHVHAVVNTSHEDRYHIIVHGNPLDQNGWRDLVETSYRRLMNETLSHGH